MSTQLRIVLAVTAAGVAAFAWMVVTAVLQVLQILHEMAHAFDGHWM